MLIQFDRQHPFPTKRLRLRKLNVIRFYSHAKPFIKRRGKLLIFPDIVNFELILRGCHLMENHDGCVVILASSSSGLVHQISK